MEQLIWLAIISVLLNIASDALCPWVNGEDSIMNITKPALKVSDFIQKWERLVEGAVDMFTYEDLIRVENEEVGGIRNDRRDF